MVLDFAQFCFLQSFALYIVWHFAQFSLCIVFRSGASLDGFSVLFVIGFTFTWSPLFQFEKLSFLFGTEILFLYGQYIFVCDSEHSSTGSIIDGIYGHNLGGIVNCLMRPLPLKMVNSLQRTRWCSH